MSSKVTVIKFAATMHNTELCRERLLDRFTPTLATIQEKLEMPRPMYWVNRVGLAKNNPRVPPTSSSKPTRPWSLLSGAIRPWYPDMLAMHAQLERAEEQAEDDDDRTIAEEWDTVEVNLAKAKVMSFMADTFGTEMSPRCDSGHDSATDNDVCLSVSALEKAQESTTCSLTVSTPAAPNQGSMATIAATCTNVENSKVTTNGWFKKVASALTISGERNTVKVTDIVQQTCKYVRKYGQFPSTGRQRQTSGWGRKQLGHEAGIRSVGMQLLMDAPSSFVTDKRCIAWCSLFDRMDGSSLVRKPCKKYSESQVTKAQTAHILVPYVLGGLLLWLSKAAVSDMDGSSSVLDALHPTDLEACLELAASHGSASVADCKLLINTLQTVNPSLWMVGSVDVRPMLGAYLLVGTKVTDGFQSVVASVLQHSF